MCPFFFLACPSGFFKPTQGDEPCMQCPINSRTTSEGAMNCVCRNGYYRTDSDPLQMPCTSMYNTEVVMWNSACTPNSQMHVSISSKSLINNIDCLAHTHSIPTSRGALGSKDSLEVCVTTNRETLSELSLTQADMPIVLLSTDLTQHMDGCPSSTPYRLVL